ncbi:hypothetical protein E2562_007132 [Oryza meyeriana var. granulata]|uniref:DUF7725 domain-containing protein n=1 Tax=Oryza meyeriana var. granulata TaxID=110450 RepID=A0A6G1CCR4_9ORYZ|nr:hypothetical protein E2562_007132 [Oryza meyeriana var. granulata]
MEAAAARKEWRAVPDAPLRSNGAEDPGEHGKMGQSEDRAMYEDGGGGLDDYCSITIDGSGGLSEDIIQQRLQSIVHQREELQQVEMELRAQVIAHPQIIEAQRSFEAAAKEHVAAAAKLKEQLHEREKYILELEMKLDDKDRELDALKIDHQTVWANQDLLREQTKELATVRRERDNSEAERAQHLKQIHDLQEHLREKESQILALEEQHRAAQENVIYKDEQLREAHAWVARVQEMDVLQSQSLQVELRERTDQFNQYWISFQQQYVEMQRGLLHTIQQLQLELNELRERTGVPKDGSQTAQESSVESTFGQNKGNDMVANGSGTTESSRSLKSNGIPDGSIKGNSSASAVPVVPSSLLGIGGFVPSAQIAGMHSYMMHPQGVPPSLASPSSAVPQFGSFQSQTTIQPNLQWSNQQEAQNTSETSDETNYQTSPSDQDALQQAASNNDELSLKQIQATHAEHPTTHGKQQQQHFPSVVSESTHEQKLQVAEPNVTEHLVYNEQQNAQDSSSMVNPIRKFEHQEQTNELKDEKVASGKQSEEQVARHQHKASDFDASTTQIHLKSGAAEFNSNVVNQTDTLTSAGGGLGSLLPRVPKEPSLLDERSLLACIVRAVPAGPDGRIKISTTLPNRLGKMLAPLHWHDYKKHYGKLDDFVASHPELFVIEGDFIHLREGAQQIISATTAAAKIAAVASSAPYSSLLPSVAVTPVAQSTRQKRGPPVDSRSSTIMPSRNGSTATNFGDQFDKSSLNAKANDSVGYNIVQGIGDVSLSNKVKDTQENGFSDEVRPAQSSIHAVSANGVRHERSGLPAGLRDLHTFPEDEEVACHWVEIEQGTGKNISYGFQSQTSSSCHGGIAAPVLPIVGGVAGKAADALVHSVPRVRGVDNDRPQAGTPSAGCA